GLSAACAQANMEVVASVATVTDAITTITTTGCDVVILDLSLGDGSRISDNVHAIHRAGSAVLVHSIADHVAQVRQSLAAGAAGVIPKSAPTTTLIAAIEAVARGEVLNNLEWATAIEADGDFSKVQLGRRERDVLHLYAAGMPLKAVAGQL